MYVIDHHHHYYHHSLPSLSSSFHHYHHSLPSFIDIYKHTSNSGTGQTSTYVHSFTQASFTSSDPIPETDLSLILSLLKQTTYYLDIEEGIQRYLDVSIISNSQTCLINLENLSTSLWEEQSADLDYHLS